MSKVKIKFAGGALSPTGSNFYIEFGDIRVLVDCGLYQSEKYVDNCNCEDFSYDPNSIDYLFVTHGHLDHVGRIPKLIRDGFKGQILSTAATRDIGALIMLDSLSIITKEAQHNNETPIYEEADIFEAISRWKNFEYHEEKIIETNIGTVVVTLLDAGHILGSSMIKFSINGENILFTGDLGNSPSPLLRDTEKLSDINYLITESVYGDRNHEDRENRVEKLKEITEKTIKNGGTLMIPAFSIERTQEILFAFNEMIEGGQLSMDIPIFLDSPLGINVTKVYKKYNSLLNENAYKLIHNGDDIFNFPGLKQTPDKDSSKAINEIFGPKIIIAGSGMSNGGRIVHHEIRYLGDPKSTLLLVGYQAVGTLGRMLEEGNKKVKIRGQDVIVRANIETIHGFSAHKDSEHILKMIGDTANTLKQVYVVLGEPKSAAFIAQHVKEYYDVEAIVPQKGDEIYININ